MDSILEKIFKIPTIKTVFLDTLFTEKIFLSSDQENGIHFILSFKHLPDPERKGLEEIMRRCGAELSSNIDETSDFSAIIVDHDVVVSTKAPAFTFYFLRDCLKAGKLEEIEKYRQNATKHIAGDVDVMDIIFYRRTRWSSALIEKDKLWLREHFSSITTEGCQSKVNSYEEQNITIRGHQKSHEHEGNTPPRQEFAACSSDSKDPFDDDLFSSRKDKKKHQKSHEHKRNTPHRQEFAAFSSNSKDPFDDDLFSSRKDKKKRLPYTQEEKEKILKYVVDYQGYRSLKGRDFWKIMESRKVCPNRTWQSMKEHFLKKLVSNLDSFDFLSDAEKDQIKYALD